jgi:hypothetical protein
MTAKSILEYEIDKLKKLSKYQLPNQFKKIGMWLFIFSIISLFINAFSINDLLIKSIIKYGMLIGLLLASISKEKIEDELIVKLRMQSYSIAFIMGVVFTLMMPFVDYIIDYFFKTKEAAIKDMGDWQILFILLSFQIFYFEILKKIHK